MTKLSVNVNKIATLRNSRGGHTPDVVAVARDILKFGAHGITVHPRPDGRHIRHQDVRDLALLVSDWNATHPIKEHVEFNIEGYPDDAYLNLLSEVKFHQATLVPDPPNVLTSNAGWKLNENLDFLKAVTDRIHKLGAVRVSLFVDVFTWSPEESSALLKTKADCIELYTETFAKSFGTTELASVLEKYQLVATEASKLGISVNAGHDLDHLNTATLVRGIPQIREVSIGHALISQALYWGLEKTVAAYLVAVTGKTQDQYAT